MISGFVDWLTPIALHPFVIAMLCFAAAMLAVMFVLNQVTSDISARNRSRPFSKLRSKLGVDGLPLWLFLLATIIWIVIVVGLIAGLIGLIWTLLTIASPGTANETWDFRFLLAQLAAITTVLGAVVAFPVTLNRLHIATLDHETKRDGQITDRINKAVENLGATRTLKRQRKRSSGKPAYEHDLMGNPVYSKPIFEEITEPNLEMRIGAIYALERIAQDSLRDHVQIMEILTAYIRENAKAGDAKNSPHEVFVRLTEDTEYGQGLTPEQAFQHGDYRKANPFGWNPTELSNTNLVIWARETLTSREDIQSALSVIGRRKPRQIEREREAGYKIDLRRTNLQGAKLEGNFDLAIFADARIDGCILNGSFLETQFGIYAERALSGASLQAAQCGRIDATGADFSGTNLDAAFFGGAILDKSRFIWAKMDRTNLNGATVQSADFAFAEARHVYCFQDALFELSRFYETALVEFKGIENGLTQRIWVASNVNMTEEQEKKFGRIGRVSGNEINNRNEYHRWRENPDTYILPQHRH
jgi:hypothetical protein